MDILSQIQIGVMLSMLSQVLKNQTGIMAALVSILENGDRQDYIKDVIATLTTQTAEVLGVSVDENKDS